MRCALHRAGAGAPPGSGSRRSGHGKDDAEEIVGRETEAGLNVEQEVGLAVSVDVAGYVGDRPVDHDAELAGVVMEADVADIFEILIAVPMAVGVDGGEVDDVAVGPDFEVEDLVVMGTLADVGNRVEDESVLSVVGLVAASTAVQDISAVAADDDVGARAAIDDVIAVAALEPVCAVVTAQDIGEARACNVVDVVQRVVIAEAVGCRSVCEISR